MNDQNSTDALFELGRTLAKAGGLIGGAAVVGCLLKGADLSALKGIGKLCAGIGIIGLGQAAGEAAGDALVKRVDDAQKVIGMIPQPQPSVQVTEV